MVNREGYKIEGDKRECTLCNSMFIKTSKTVTLCNKCNSERVKSQSPIMKMYRRAKSRSKEFKREFNIAPFDITIPSHCPILGIELATQEGSGGKINSPSLDRIDSSKGYTKDNIQVISALANRMKSNADKENLIKFSKWVLLTFSTE